MDVSARARAAVVAGLVADAAVNPVRWMYDQDALTKFISDTTSPEFHKWGCPFYVDEVGSFSCYGNQAYNLLQSLVENKGLDVKQYAKDIYKFFGPESSHKPQPTCKAEYPKQGAWVNSSIRKSFDKLKEGDALAGQDEGDADGFSKVIPVVALYAGTDQLESMVDAAVRTTLNNQRSVDTAIAYAKLLETAILTGSFDVDKWFTSLPDGDVKDDVKAVFEKKNEPYISSAKQFGIACALPGSWRNTILALIQSKDMVSAVRLTLSGGGGSCARAMAVAALFAAQDGNDTIPDEWITKTIHGAEVARLADELVKLRK